MSNLQDIRVYPGHHIVGEVKDGHIHVHDIVHNGVSEKYPTGCTPELHPIPVSKIEDVRKMSGIYEPITSEVKH